MLKRLRVALVKAGLMAEPASIETIAFSSLSTPDRKALYDLNREYIKHEDNLINFRLTWLLTIHGFLYATYGFSAQSLANASAQLASKTIENGASIKTMQAFMNNAAMAEISWTLYALIWLMIIISLVGLGISILGMRSIAAANRAARTVAAIFEHVTKTYTLADGCRVYNLDANGETYLVPTLTGGGYIRGEKHGLVAAKYIPLVLITSWLVSLAYDIRLHAILNK